MKKFSKSVKYVGTDDKTIDLFESQYIVPKGVSYNSYVIFDEKITVMDTADKRRTDEWLANVKAALGDKNPPISSFRIWSPTIPPPSRLF